MKQRALVPPQQSSTLDSGVAVCIRATTVESTPQTAVCSHLKRH